VKNFFLCSIFYCVFWGALAHAQSSPLASSPWMIKPTAAVTDVLDAADKNNPFDLHIEASYRYVRKTAQIMRESVIAERAALSHELDYQSVTHYLDTKLRVGLYHDLELNAFLPIALSQDNAWHYANGVSANNSLITVDPFTQKSLFATPYKSYKSGLSSFDIGLSWGVFNQHRDDTKPSWTVSLSYRAPIGAAFAPVEADPSHVNNGTDSAKRAAIGDKAHRVIFSTALSKRFGMVEPYLSLTYRLPIVAGAAVSGYMPSHEGDMFAGIEITPWQDEQTTQRITFDIRGISQYVSSGRVYSELTDPLRRLTLAGDYAVLGGRVAILAQFHSYIRLVAGLDVTHQLSHFLTLESAGTDKNGNGIVDLNDPQELNPYYRDYIDRPGSRFRVDKTLNLQFFISAIATF